MHQRILFYCNSNLFFSTLILILHIHQSKLKLVPTHWNCKTFLERLWKLPNIFPRIFYAFRCSIMGENNFFWQNNLHFFWTWIYILYIQDTWIYEKSEHFSVFTFLIYMQPIFWFFLIFIFLSKYEFFSSYMSSEC